LSHGAIVASPTTVPRPVEAFFLGLPTNILSGELMLLIPEILVGIFLLILGRKLFWLFVAGVGFFAATSFTSQLFGNQPEWFKLIIALATGIIGALLAIFLQRIAIGIAGFLAGGYLTISLLDILGVELARLAWLPLIVGGFVGALLVLLLFDWALIILSSLVGASLISQAIPLEPPLGAVLFIGSLCVGTVTQTGMMRADKSKLQH
jgi:hypothetical protein